MGAEARKVPDSGQPTRREPGSGLPAIQTQALLFLALGAVRARELLLVGGPQALVAPVQRHAPDTSRRFPAEVAGLGGFGLLGLISAHGAGV
jgi:hypothetical protein